ncbi:hypothetical protein Tco_1516725 [Tanacetum coccineum]
MTKLAFCDYHNMVAILEKTESNTDFHQIVDFLEDSHIRVKTVDGETMIIAKFNDKQHNVTESSIRRHLKLLNDEGWKAQKTQLSPITHPQLSMNLHPKKDKPLLRTHTTSNNTSSQSHPDIFQYLGD